MNKYEYFEDEVDLLHVAVVKPQGGESVGARLVLETKIQTSVIKSCTQ